jgi:Yip1 domain
VNLFERVKNILLDPKTEWPTIATEAATPQSLYLGYIMILAAIGPIVILLTYGGIGSFGIRVAIAAYINSLIGVAVLALIVDVLSTNFGGSRDFTAALKLTAYSFTATWVAQIALFIPILGWLVVLAGAIYGFYLFFLGAPILKKCAADKAAIFTIIVLLCAIVLMYLVRLVLLGLGVGAGMSMSGMSMGMLQP